MAEVRFAIWNLLESRFTYETGSLESRPHPLMAVQFAKWIWNQFNRETTEMGLGFEARRML